MLTTDHGLPFPGAKATLFDRGIGVMLILRGPGGFQGGRVIDAMVSHLDLYPTLCDLADRATGVPAGPLAAAARARETAGCTTRSSRRPPITPPTSPSARSARARFKYIRRFGDRELPVLPNTDDGPSKDVLLAARLGGAAPRRASSSTTSLLDPTRRATSSTIRRTPASRATCAGGWSAGWSETDDPLLRGPVPLPPRGRANNPRALSADEPLTQLGSAPGHGRLIGRWPRRVRSAHGATLDLERHDQPSARRTCP